MFQETRSDRAVGAAIGWWEGVSLFLIGGVLDLLGDWRGIPYVVAGSLFDPDSYMRLVRIEAGLRAGHIGSVVARDASGHGVILHWSHLLDSLLLLAAAPFEPLLGWHRALFWAGAVSGPIAVSLLAVAVAWVAAPLAERRFRWFAAVAVGVSPGIGALGRLGVVHYHVLLVLAAVMTAGFAFRAAAGERGRELAAAAWLAFGLWLSPEAWPYGLLALGALGVAWLTGTRDAARELTSAGLFLALLLGAILLVDPPPGAAVAFDHVSVVHLSLAVVVATLGWGMMGLERLPLAPPVRLAGGTACAAALFGVWGAIFPRALLGPAGLTMAKGAALFFAAISEWQPATQPVEAVAFLLLGVFGVAVAGWLALRTRSWLAAYGAFCSVVVLVLGFRYVRFSAYPEAFGAAMLPVALTAISRTPAASPVRQMLYRVGVLALVLLVPRAAPALDRGPVPMAVSVGEGSSCDLGEVASRFAPYVGEIVLSNPNLSPELLYRTRVDTVGSLYHRGLAAFLRLRAAWLAGPSSGVPDAVRASGAQLVLFCPRAARTVLLREAPHDALLAKLEAGEVPAWLRPLWHDQASDFTLYQVEGAAAQRAPASSVSRKSRNTAMRLEFRSSSGYTK